MAGRQKEKIAWLQHLIEYRREFLGRRSFSDTRGRVDDRRVEHLPTLRVSDLKDNQILGIVMAFERAATTARYNRCCRNALRRLPLEVPAERSQDRHVFLQSIENQTDALIQEL